jgi:hypothetical protein
MGGGGCKGGMGCYLCFCSWGLSVVVLCVMEKGNRERKEKERMMKERRKRKRRKIKEKNMENFPNLKISEK